MKTVVTTTAQGLSRSFVGVPVIVDENGGYVSADVPASIAGIAIPRKFSSTWCEVHGLTKEAGATCVLRNTNGSSVVLVSLGGSYNDLEAWRKAAAGLVRLARESSSSLLLPTDSVEDVGSVAQAVTEGAVLASYRYKKRDATEFDLVPLGQPLPPVSVHDAVVAGSRTGAAISAGVNWARRLIDTPALEMPPKKLAKAMEEHLAAYDNISCEIWTSSRVREERLGALLGVGQGSSSPVRLVMATYTPVGDESAPHVVLVGKGITFDSGGLSLKPAESMMTMKTDMSGAAVVMSALAIASQLRLPVRVTAIAPLAENMVSGTSLRPGDVVTARNGQTIEVLNTDAEGRLVLADALTLASELEPDAIIDIATLTGAQRVALGDEVGALFANTADLAEEVLAASEQSGEAFWRLPLVPAYRSHLDSEVADVKNIGRPGNAGSIVAALFLERFVAQLPWAHLDVAGPSRSDSARGYVPRGATAFGLRAIVAFLRRVAHD